ncbi:carbohydrate ABC transporter permease [Desertihabitans brevis]|uniref:Carbohydrate ABC transporter permease n=1 Tax=Desertihabitans brevis TaxID=2268447 RepID=A0A367YU21_9ACTN|nr:carbohydrate ABC transporter permease [Desertihabitans brevis]RCK69354.1 carbohydrate ABC transporter permease [Desertihabitans brevis]
MSRARTRLARTVVHRVLVALLLVYLLAPFAWMLLYSLYPATALQTLTPDLDPSQIRLDSYAALLSDPSFLTPMANSAVVGLATTVLCMVLGSGCAYVIARYRFRGRSVLLLGMLTVQAVPVIVLAVPLFILLRAFGQYDTLLGLVITYTAFILPLVVWMMVGFFEELPPSLERAAVVDGCNRLQIMTRIAVPLAAPGLAAAAVLAFITAWSDFFLAKVLTITSATTLPVRTAAFQGLFAMDYTSAATAGVITAAPVLLLALVAQKWIIRGLVEGAVKG